MKKYLIKLLFLAVFFSLNSIAALGPEDLVKKTAEDVLFAIKADKKFKKGIKKRFINWQRKALFPNFDFEKVDVCLGAHGGLQVTNKKKNLLLNLERFY